MKTPAEFEPIAVWMGWRKRKFDVCSWWEDGKGIDLGAIETKTSLTDAEAVEALKRLVEKGYSVCMSGGPVCWGIAMVDDNYRDTYAEAPTISAAVEEALLKLIAAEVNHET